MSQLDIKDRKILYELDVNSRQSFLSIAKKVKLSREVVNYRVNKFIENGIITNFTTVIDISKIGVKFFRVSVSLTNIKKNTEEEIINYLKSITEIGWGIRDVGNWNITFIFWAKKTCQFINFLNDFVSLFGDYILDKKIVINDWAKLYPKTFLLDKRLDVIPSYDVNNTNSKVIELNNKDLHILSLLSSNSRISVLDLSNKVGLSPTTVFSRIKFFEKEKIILFYSINIDVSKIGLNYYFTCINFKSHDKKRYDEFIGYCNYHNNIWSTVHWVGLYDLIFDVYIENDEKYLELLDDIRELFSDIIKEIKTKKSGVAFKYNLFPIKIE